MNCGLISRRGDTESPCTIQQRMKQPTNQEQRNEDKKKPEKEDPSPGIDPKTEEPQMEVNQRSEERQKENQSNKKGPRAA
jgi:hypothetical protein